MSDALRESLQQALGDRYALERELGGGGMSRVFLAEERALTRRVVVKVLPPELSAALNAERFRREILLSARLQHPHLVPVLSAGTSADGLLYYTMPYIDGDSLRGRLTREGRLPIPEAVRIFREVAGALAYAHRQGLVHRDIKPENILFSEGHAVVTDFGVAKALARGAGERPAGAELPEDLSTPSPAPEALTNLGVSIGTAAYMAPEQGSADPSTDHRADIYSLGAVAYEMLSGQTLFGQRAPAQLIAAHVIEAPTPIAARRPDVPPALAALVMRCLEKDPARRPQSGEELVRALDALSTTSGEIVAPERVGGGRVGGGGGAAGGRRKLAIAGAMALLVAAAAGAAFFLRPRGVRADSPLDRRRVVVAPFENQTGDPALEPVGRMAADWLTQGLAQTGLVTVVDSRTALAGARKAGGAAGDDNIQKMAAEVSARTVVTGGYFKRRDTLQFQAKIVDAATGEVVRALPEVKGPAADPVVALDLLRQQALGALAQYLDPRIAAFAQGGGRPPTYEAYQEFVAALDDMMRGEGAGAVRHFLRAAELDTTYAQARLLAADQLNSLGRSSQAESLLLVVARSRERLSPIDRALLDAQTASLRGDRAAALSAAREGARLAPGTEWSFILARSLVRTNRPREALDSLPGIDPNLGLLKGTMQLEGVAIDANHLLGRFDENLTLVRSLQRRYPENRNLLAEEAAALAALGRTGEIPALIERAAARVPRGGSPRNVLRAVAAELRAHGQPDAARPALERALASYAALPADSLALPAYRNGRALTLFMLERWADARSPLSEAAATDSSGEMLGPLGVIAARTGDTAEAERIASRIAAIRRPYLYGRPTFARARIAAALGRREQAVELLREAEAQGVEVARESHLAPELAALRGYAPYDDLVRPKG